MKRKGLILCVFGFLFGAAMAFIVPALINHAPISTVIYSDRFLQRVGSPAAAMLLTLVVMGLFGTVCVGGMLFYEIERWPLALATAMHYFVISLGYLIPSWLLCWDLPMRLLLIIEGLMTGGFFLIWIILYLRYKLEVRKLNILLQEYKVRQQNMNINRIPGGDILPEGKGEKKA